MRVSNTSERLQHILNTRKLKQIDILEAAKPYCEKYGVKLNKNDLSQYVNGKAEPGQKKLTVLSLALGVSETWLMGYDTNDPKEEENVEIHTIAAHAVRKLNEEDAEKILKFAQYLLSEEDK